MDSDVYDGPDGRAIIHYSRGGTCEEGVPGLGNIPPDIVVDIYVSLKQEVKLSDVVVSGREYERIRAAHTPHIYYVDKEKGVTFTAVNGMVGTISYFGSAEDEKKFSCGDYKYAAPVPTNPNAMRVEQYPFDSYGKISFEDATARLDNFVIQLLELNKEKSEYRGFIIVYAGRSAHIGEAQSVADCSKDYLVKVREANPETIVAVDGGYQGEFRVYLFITPNDAYPPMLLPTVSPRKVETLQSTFTPCKSQ
ncbi:MAG TPA: hypothetical protein VLQ90_13045 [Pyrinomonadaceae bacterium]|nr:hypothetical protein [Pyrinomonadaceae bacterium]